MPKINPRNIEELVSSHYIIHAFWNKTKRGQRIKNWPPEKIKRIHTKYVKLFRRYYIKKHPNKGYFHRSPLR